MIHSRTGYEEMGPPPSQHFAGVNAAAYAALVAALSGGRSAAERWLRAVEEAPAVPAPIEELTLAPARLAATVLATDALDEERASELVGRLGDHLAGYEIWPFIAAAIARFDLLFRTPSLGLARLDDICDAQGASSRLGTIAGGLLLRMRADLLLEAGEGNAVLAMASEHSGLELLRVPVARAHLRAGHLSQAIRVSSAKLRHPAAPRRDTLDHLLVLASAQLRRDDPDDASSLFRSAMDYFETTGNRSAFREMDADDLARLCDLVDVENPLASRPTSLAAQNVQLVRLTPREEVVLRALASGDTFEAIARRLSVSVNTVRSQVRSVYRKLGVSSRADAVAIAARGGVLRMVRR
jgi:LuxR family maltose regulon positive regulatory protein